MNYLTIVAAVFGTIWGVFFLLLFHYVVFTVIGIFKKKSFPHTDEKNVTASSSAPATKRP